MNTDKLITFSETKDFLYIKESDMNGDTIAMKGYKKLKPQFSAEELVEELE